MSRDRNSHPSMQADCCECHLNSHPIQPLSLLEWKMVMHTLRARARWPTRRSGVAKAVTFPRDVFQFNDVVKMKAFPCCYSSSSFTCPQPASHDNIKAGDESFLVENFSLSRGTEIPAGGCAVARGFSVLFCFFSSFHHPISWWSSTPQNSIHASKDLAGRRPRNRNVCVHEGGCEFKSPSWKRGALTFLESPHKHDQCLINQEQHR